MLDWVEPVVRYVLVEGLQGMLRVAVVSLIGASIPAATCEAAASGSPAMIIASTPARASRQPIADPISPPPTISTSAALGRSADSVTRASLGSAPGTTGIVISRDPRM